LARAFNKSFIHAYGSVANLTVKPHRTQFCRSHTRGVAAVEFAVCLPVIVMLVFGSIEASSFIFLKQSLHVSAYEGARNAIRIGSTNASATNSVQTILTARNVRDFEVAFPNGESGDAKRGEEIVIEVSAPSSTNSPLAGQFVTNRQLTARVVMVKE
jgi:Flp pilus assembly protein TadG